MSDAAPAPAAPASPEDSDAGAPSPGLLARLGLALVGPRWALAVGVDRRHAGRSGSDLLALIVVVVVATQLRGLVAAAWIGAAVAPGLGVRAAVDVLTRALTVELGFLVVGALALWLLGGPRRHLGRAFDLACVAALPLLFLDLGATVVVRGLELAAGVAAPGLLAIVLSAVSFAWAGALLALALRPARVPTTRPPPVPAGERARARRAGLAVLAVAALGVATQVGWIVSHVDSVRPMRRGDPAPALALATIGPAGQPGAQVSLAQHAGKVVVLDFWATWCNPCLRALPGLDALTARHPDIVVIAINLDDAVAARALWDKAGYRLTLVADDGEVSARYGVREIPHSVVIDRAGVVRMVARGGAGELEAVVTQILREAASAPPG